MKFVHIPDLHVRDEQPHYDAIKLFFDWILKHPVINDKDTIIIQGGDLAHRSIPRPKEVDLLWMFFKGLKVREIIINSGNHDYDDDRKIFAGIPFRNLDNVTVVDSATLIERDGIKMTFLPWQPHNIKQPYQTRDKSINPDDTDFLFYHFPDETVGMKSYVNLKQFKGHRIGSDIHDTSSPNYPGVAYPTRKSEMGSHNSLICYEDGELSRIEVPNVFDYYRVSYEDKVNCEASIPYLIITNAPSYELAREKFKEYHIHSTILDVKDTTEGYSSNTKRSSPEEYFNDFVMTRSIDERVEQKLRKVLLYKER